MQYSIHSPLRRINDMLFLWLELVIDFRRCWYLLPSTRAYILIYSTPQSCHHSFTIYQGINVALCPVIIWSLKFFPSTN